MAEPTLSVAAGVAFVGAALYGYVGVRFSQRRVSAETRLAAVMFSVWWLGLATTTAIGGALNLTGAIGNPSLPLVSGLTYLNLVLICVAFLGLVYYLVYLYTGRKEVLLPLVAFYSALGVMLSVFVATSVPTGVIVSRWSVGLTYARPVTGPFVLILLALLILPEMVAAIVYFTLYFKLRERGQRLRVAVVSLSLLLWFGIGFLSSAAGFSRTDAGQIFSRALGLSAALAIFLAYFPPEWLRNRFGLAAAVD